MTASTQEHPVREAAFVKGIVGTDPILEDGRPHVAFVGRSNVGKSSVINTLIGRSVARKSKKPGKTREINFYLINNALYFVDLPGYGYAKISARDAEDLRKRIIWYLARTEGVRPRVVVLVVDIQAGITELDHDMLAILTEEKYPIVIIANKRDKLNQSEQVHKMRRMKDVLPNVNVPEITLLSFSARTGWGSGNVFDILTNYVDF